MTAVSKILSIAANRFKLMLRNKVLIVLCLLLPLMFSFLVNKIFAKSALYDSIPIGIIDEDDSETSKKILLELKNNSTISMEVLKERDIEGYISKEKVQAVYILKKGMESKLENGDYDGLISVYAVPGSITAMGISDIIAGEIIPYICQGKLVNGASQLLKNSDKAEIKKSIVLQLEKLEDNADYKLPVNIAVKSPDKSVEVVKQKGDSYSIQIGIGMIIMFSTIFMLAGCSTIIKERENNVRSRILVSGIPPLDLLCADMTAVATAGLLITFLQFALMSKILIGLPYMAIILVMSVSFIYILCTAVMLILIASIFRSHISFQSFMPVVVLLMGILSGCIWSVEMMPQAMEKVSKCIPSFWAHNALTEIVLYRGSFGSVKGSIAVMAIMLTAFLIPVYLIYRRE